MAPIAPPPPWPSALPERAGNRPYAAKLGRDALQTHWNDAASETRSSHEIVAHYHAIADGRSDVSGSSFQSSGDPANAFGGEAFEASYDFPFLAHAAMEPMNCVAIADGWSVKLISGSQLQTVDQVRAGLTALVLPGMVEIETLQPAVPSDAAGT